MRTDRAISVRKTAAVLAIVTVSHVAHAQVNVEAVRGDANRQGVSGRGEVSATGRTGNTAGVIAGGNGRVQLHAGRHLSFLYGTGNYARFNQKTSVARAMGHLRYNYELVDWLWAEAYGQIEHDEFQRLGVRELLGLGPRVELFQNETVGLCYGTAYMAEWESLNLADTDTDDSTTMSHRWNHYLTFSAKLDTRLSTGTTLYVQPRLDRFADYRMLNETYFEVGITDVISAKASTWLRFDSEPPDEVDKTDFLVTNAFVAKF